VTVAAAPAPESRPVVLDTNIVLDLLVFRDPATSSLRTALAGQRLQWIATPPMRMELLRVLGYPQVVKSLRHHAVLAEQVLASFDAQASMQTVAPKAPVTCKDADDQKFIDLAVAHQATLLSKDKAVLCMKKRLALLAVCAGVTLA
jgi:putative PIN family toxin of toxin-antitoxin system